MREVAMFMRDWWRRLVRFVRAFTQAVSGTRDGVALMVRAVVQPLERRVLLSLSPTATLDTSTISEGGSVALTLTSNEEGPESVTGWIVHWNDGTDDTLTDGDTTVNHTYANDGHYGISTETDTDDIGSWGHVYA